MRTLFKLIASLIVAGGIVGVLMFTGVLQFNSKPRPTNEKISQPATLETKLPAKKAQPAENEQAFEGEKQQSREEKPHTEAATGPKTETSGTKPEPEQKTADTAAKKTEPSALQQKDESGALPAAEQATGKATPKDPYITIGDEIYQRALSYLYFLAKDDAGNKERRFSEFLKTEFQLSDKQVDQLLQMTFWKNFLVFQKDWSAEEGDVLQQAFDREIRLKKAGFEAKGIHLMNAEINAAKERLLEMQKQLVQSSGEQATTMEGTP